MKASEFLSQLGVDDDEFTTNYEDYDVEVEDIEIMLDVTKIEFDHSHKKIIIRTD